MLSFNSLTLRRGPRALVENLSATIFAGQRVGLVGRNGTGKSSLFALILGEIAPDKGECSLPRNIQIATVAQEARVSTQSALDYVLDGDVELRRVEAELEIAEHAHDAHAISDLHERLNAIDGYAARSRAGRLLHGLAFSSEEQNQSVANFSGGWRMRLNLAKALMCRSQLLLLDEPTNHLDLDAVFWLQEWLTAYEGTLVVISHDREFLDAVTTHTLHLAQGTGTFYTGNYSAFERLRAERTAQQSAQRDQQQRQIAHLQSFVDRFKASAAKARMAQSRVKMIERIQLTTVAAADSEFNFSFHKPDRLPSPLLRLYETAVGYGERTVIANIKASIEPGDRIGLLGPNGAGKSTFVKLLSGELQPQHGEATRHPDLKVGYFAQHQLEQLDVNGTPMDHFRKLEPNKGEQELRKILGTFNFTGDKVFEPVGPFSGGEKARLALAMVVHLKPNLLLLDEPTNHLDLDMRAALEMALQEFEGALVLVSHDRHLVGSVCDVLWRVSDGSVGEFDGDLDDYARWLSQREREYNRNLEKGGAKRGAANAGSDGASNDAKGQKKQSADQKAREKPLRQSLKNAEARLQKAQTRMTEIDALLQSPTMFDAGKRIELAMLTQEQAKLKGELGEAEEAWLEAASALEAIAS